MSSFLRRKKLDIGSRQEFTGAETVVCCCFDRQMYRSQNRRMPLFWHWQFFLLLIKELSGLYIWYSAYVQRILLFWHWQFFLLSIKELPGLRTYIQKKIKIKQIKKSKKIKIKLCFSCVTSSLLCSLLMCPPFLALSFSCVPPSLTYKSFLVWRRR
jgi:hypothetical protein